MPRPCLTPEQQFVSQQRANERRRKYYINNRHRFALCDYSTAYIYKMVCPASNLVYIGASAIQPKYREQTHRQGISKGTNKTYSAMSEIAPACEWRLEVITLFPCTSRKELEDLETLYIAQYGPRCLNKRKKFTFEAVAHLAAKFSPEVLPVPPL